MKSGASRRQGNGVNLSDRLTTLTTSCNKASLPQSGRSVVVQGMFFPELNPSFCSNPSDVLIVKGLVNDSFGSNNVGTASISCLGHEKGGEFTRANTGEADSDWLVYTKVRDVTASGSTQTGRGRQAGVADKDVGNPKDTRYLHHSALK